ncbi:MAG: glycosyltransferase family 2 protein [Bacilli bacterium]|nr:glycosyltransferase family 2 protein [Bacilli bacterium]
MLSLMKNQYLGTYSQLTLIKGPIFPMVLYCAKGMGISFSSLFTLLYIFSSLFFAFSMKKIINNNKFFLVLYLLLIFNPITYSAEVFQRLYVNTISIPETLIFLGFVVNIITSDEVKIRDCIGLGVITAIMLLTRNDNIWIFVVMSMLIIYKLIKKKQLKVCYIFLFPILITTGAFLLISSINYKHYQISTYNELENTHFRDAYSKILQIKDENKKLKISIPKTTLYELSEKSKIFGLTKKEVKRQYKLSKRDEVDNGDIIWFFRFITYDKHHFLTGRQADKYYKELSNELDTLFETGELKKEKILPSIYLNSTTNKALVLLPRRILKAIYYTSTYENVRTYSIDELEAQEAIYNNEIDAYSMIYRDYRYAENIITKNTQLAEIMRTIYKIFIVLFSFIALIIYFKNIKKLDNLGFIINIILLVYLLILGGVVYTDITAFHAIRYRYLCNVYILQSIFIMLNLGRIYLNRVETDNTKLASMSDKVTKKINGIKVSVIIPAYNEEKAIDSTIREINEVLKKHSIYKGSEVIVVNDGSSDKTGKIAAKSGAIVINNSHNMGYGFSLKKGIKKAKNNLIVITDADGTYPFNYVPKMIQEQKQGFDLVIGARCGKYYRQSTFKNILRKALKKLVEFVTDRKIEDVNSGLRVFEKSTVVKYLPLLCNTFSFSTTETLTYAMNNHNIAYVDIPYQKRVGKSKIKLVRDSIKVLQYILKLSVYYRPLKIYYLFTFLGITISLIGLICSNFTRIRLGYVLGIGGLLVFIILLLLGFLASHLKQNKDK